MVNSECNYTDQKPEVIEVIEKYRSAETLNEEERREILSVLGEEKHLNLFRKKKAYKTGARESVSYVFLNVLAELKKLESLDLSWAQAVSLPDSIGSLRSLKKLRLVNTQIVELPESIGKLENLKNLELVNTQIQALPESIGKLGKLSSLKLANTQISMLPEEIRKLKSLRNLYLSNNNISELPETIGELTALQNLYLSNLQISELPESIGKLTGLQSLCLKNLQISRLPDSIGNLTGLQNLDLRNSKLIRLPESLGNLKNLCELNLINTMLSELPDSIGNLCSLRNLYLVNTRICELPESIGNLTSLQSLNLRNTRIKTLPDSIGSLITLQSLGLNNTKVCELPESIGNLTNLQNLNLCCSQISSLPESIGNLTSLQSLNLSETMIDSLPESIGNLTGLQRLNLRDTGIKELPESIGNLSKLQGLYLRNTIISELPESLGSLTDLQSLDLRNIPIWKLPENLGGLTSLQTLTLGYTQITGLPESIGELGNLQNLYLNHTDISELPESIVKLRSLRNLFLNNSRISRLPEKMGALPKLETLVLENLTLLELPESLLDLNLFFRDKEYSDGMPSGIYIHNLELRNQLVEIFSQSRELIAGYYQSNKASSPINECKIVFLGDGGAGKTLMIDRLMYDGDFSPDFTGESTPGICIRSKKYRIKEEEIELHFWDFGGQAIMHSMHRLFLTSRTLYVVVANARDNKANEQAWYWIRNIKSFANGAPVLLLVNQKDQNPSANVNQTGLKKEYEHLKAVGIVSALKSTREEFNVEIRDVICGIISEMGTVRTPLSKSWLSLMNDLQEMPDDYITSDAFYAKCREKGVGTEKMILDEIISWYQDLGVCFYSRKHPVTSQYMVLKPRWLLNALYILIFNGRKYAVNGIIQEKDIYELICEPVPDENVKKVWNDIVYHPHEIQYIINVLLNFGLIYRLDQERFFLPMLCDEDESEALNRFESEDTIHISFEYIYLPENVLHCLMVRHGYELNTDTVWRTGAVFERKSCGWGALVRIRDNCLDVYVRADDAQKHPVNSYLDMIRESVYRINDSLGLHADEFIAYRRESKEDRFEYRILTGSKEAGLDKVYSAVFKRAIEIDEILGILERSKKLKNQLIKMVLEQMLSVLAEMSERCVHLAGRDEVELTADYHNAIAPVLNAKFKIQTAREYTLGRSKKKIGETDLYFFRYQDGIKEELYILENKKIRDFTAQYRQLMGYLNPDFSAGITLSINTDKGWEEAFDFIYGRLEILRDEKDDFAPVLIDRITESKRTQYIRTEHIVPETGQTMPVYHLVLQLSDEARQRIAVEARR